MVKIFRHSLGDFELSTTDLVESISKALEQVLQIGMLINKQLMNIQINSRALEIEDLPTKSVVLSSKITKRMSENLHHSTYRLFNQCPDC